VDRVAVQSGTFSLSGTFEAERLRGAHGSPGSFRVLGIRPSGTTSRPSTGSPGPDVTTAATSAPERDSDPGQSHRL
jgi:hypothetical protein